MERLNPDSGLCHFVFANDDVYFTESLMRLNLKQYIYYELKQLNYQGIFMLSGDDIHCTLSIADAMSMSVYDQYRKKSVFAQIFGKDSSVQGATRINQEHPEEFFECMIQMMQKEKKLAFVCSINIFAMLSQYPDYVQALCELAKKNYSKNHMVIILAPTAVEGSLPYFADVQSVFRSELFAEIRQIFTVHENVYIYERLRQVMGSGILFMNYLEYSDIQKTVQYFVLAHPQYLINYKNIEADCTDYIWMYYHSDDFRMHAKTRLPENPYRVMREIEIWLNEQSHINRLIETIKMYRAQVGYTVSLRRVFARKYQTNSFERLMYEEPDVSKHLDHILKELLKTSSDKRDKDTKDNSEAKDTHEYNEKILNLRDILKLIQGKLMRPAVTIMPKELENFMNRCAGELLDACINNDIFSAQKAVNALKFAVEWRGSENIFSSMSVAEQEKVFLCQSDYYVKIISVAEKLGTIAEIYNKAKEELREERIRKRKSMESVEAFLKRFPWVEDEEHRMASDAAQKARPEMLMLTQLRQAVVVRDKAITEKEYMQTHYKGLMIQYKDNIQKMEMAMNSVLIGDIGHLQENMSNAEEIIKQAFMQNDLLMNELSEEYQEEGRLND